MGRFYSEGWKYQQHQLTRKEKVLFRRMKISAPRELVKCCAGESSQVKRQMSITEGRVGQPYIFFFFVWFNWQHSKNRKIIENQKWHLETSWTSFTNYPLSQLSTTQSASTNYTIYIYQPTTSYFSSAMRNAAKYA